MHRLKMRYQPRDDYVADRPVIRSSRALARLAPEELVVTAILSHVTWSSLKSGQAVSCSVSNRLLENGRCFIWVSNIKDSNLTGP